jgi:serine/threonine-protein kinase
MTKDLWKTRWAKGERLGKGGHGLAYHARPLVPSDGDATFVLKELIKQKDPERRARMHREVASLETLEHAAIAKLIDSNARDYKDDVELYLVTEFVPGANLEDAVNAKRPSLQEAVEMVLRLLDAVEYCHTRGILHRDLKPDNVVLRNNVFNDPVIIDFGQSFNLEEESGTFTSDPEQHLGNRFVILPEFSVIGGDKRDRTSDITQMVAILFFALSGVNPGHMIDSQNRKPHERAPGKPELERLDEKALRQGSRIFDVGFNNEKLRRWQTIAALRAEVTRLLSPDDTETRSFTERILALKQRLAETPTYAVIDRTEQMTKFVVAGFDESWNRLYDELGGALRDGAFGTFQISSAPNQAFRGITFKTKYDLSKKISLAVFGTVSEGEYILWAHDGKENTEIHRLGLFDPAADQIIFRAVEHYLCGRVESILS